MGDRQAVRLSDSEYMERALQLAERGRGLTSPNPMVGAVVVLPDGTIAGQGFHERAGGPHAEIHALDAAGDRARGAVLYCTLEPCCHAGRTGPCVERIAAAGVTRVVAASEDPNPLVAGRGFQYLRQRGVSVDVGIGRERATQLNRPFFTFMRHGRPFVIMKVALSLDGRIAVRPGVRTDLTSIESKRHAHGVRAEVDAIAVGSGTVLVDDPLLTARGVCRRRPLTRVIFDRRLRVPSSARVFSTHDAGPVIIVTTPATVASQPGRVRALEAAGAALEPIADGDLRAAFTRLACLDVTSVLLEGGTQLHRAAWEAGIVDAVHLYVAPVTLGPDGVPWLDAHTFSADVLTDRCTRACGPDVMTEGYVYRPD